MSRAFYKEFSVIHPINVSEQSNLVITTVKAIFDYNWLDNAPASNLFIYPAFILAITEKS
ncbi:MAG: hypothetical protein KME32_01540 [Mojavia pulchra JT2-VF2]|jgi:hypothetical protein|uniref:Uncharacterized protein n=1 Tax=Mojavia pulchra JT2-VF2 TaxID=287848 RepID=A0A951UE51_9NOST|nr:hypothetical protein [Mojavia pulchra JT2-VF2]